MARRQKATMKASKKATTRKTPAKSPKTGAAKARANAKARTQKASDRVLRRIEKGDFDAAPGRILKPMSSAARSKSAKAEEERRMKTNALTRVAYYNDPDAVRDRKKREYHRKKIREEVEGLKPAALRGIVKAVKAASPAKVAKMPTSGLMDALMDAVDEKGLEAKDVREHLEPTSRKTSAPKTTRTTRTTARKVTTKKEEKTSTRRKVATRKKVDLSNFKPSFKK